LFGLAGDQYRRLVHPNQAKSKTLSERIVKTAGGIEGLNMDEARDIEIMNVDIRRKRCIERADGGLAAGERLKTLNQGLLAFNMKIEMKNYNPD
jgi:hypothetical protein